MKKYGYVLHHSYELENGCDEAKLLGVFSSYEKAETAISEYKKLPVQNIYGKTTIAVEYPLPVNENADAEPYYPVPTKNSQSIYEKYRAKADMYKNMKLCGRLAEYRYYDMDQIIDSALQLCHTIG